MSPSSPSTLAAVALPPTCEAVLFERFRRAEAMALWAIRAVLAGPVPPHARAFLAEHEQEEREHLHRFEQLTGTDSWTRLRPPRMPTQWPACAVQLYGYETLGLQFATLLGQLRPDLSQIAEEEARHVAFFEREVAAILAAGGTRAGEARLAARAWWRRLPSTLSRYLQGDELHAYRERLAADILTAVAARFQRIGLAPALGPRGGESSSPERAGGS